MTRPLCPIASRLFQQAFELDCLMGAVKISDPEVNNADIDRFPIIRKCLCVIGQIMRG